MERADVLIAGGGVIGTSIAFHLAEAGVDVLLCERAELGSGSTSKGAGGVRGMFSDELNVRIGLRSLEAWAAFGGRPGADVGFEHVGYLFLLSSAEQVREFERGVALQNRLGLPSRMVSPTEAHELSPLAGLEGVLAAAFCPARGTRHPRSGGSGLRRRRPGPRRAGAHRLRGHRASTGPVRAGRRPTGRGPWPHRRWCAPPGPGRARSGSWPASSWP